MNGRGAVLVVDDEPGMRDMLEEALSYEGFDVEVAAGGAAAIEAIRRRNFDIAITDLLMPGMDGIATLDALRKLDPQLAVIVITGFASVDTAVKCLSHGAFDYLRKPFDLTTLLQVLDRAAEHRRIQGELKIYEESRALVPTLELPQLIEAGLGLAARLLRADDAALVLARGQPPGLSFHGLRADRAPSLALLEQLLAEVWSTGAPALVRGSPPLAAESYGSALAYSMPSRDRGLGALVLFRRAGTAAFLPSDLRAGVVLSTQLALLLDNARRYDEVAKRIEGAER